MLILVVVAIIILTASFVQYQNLNRVVDSMDATIAECMPEIIMLTELSSVLDDLPATISHTTLDKDQIQHISGICDDISRKIETYKKFESLDDAHEMEDEIEAELEFVDQLNESYQNLIISFNALAGYINKSEEFVYSTIHEIVGYEASVQSEVSRLIQLVSDQRLREFEIITEFAEENKNVFLGNIILFGILLTIIITALNFYLTKTVSLPIEELRMAVSQITESKLKAIPVSDSTDDISLLKQAFNTMAYRLNELFREKDSVLEHLKVQNIKLDEARQKAEQSNRLKIKFLHNMSHEIRTPLNGILGFSKILNKSNLADEKRNHYTGIIYDRGLQLIKIVEDIIDISELETNQVKIKEEKTCLNDLIKEAELYFNKNAKIRHIPLKTEKSLSERECTVYTDRVLLKKIIRHIVGNALKFTSEGYVELGYQRVNDTVQLYVKDTGIGIIDERLDDIFEPFIQENEVTDPKYGGLGLGLSIARGYAILLGGGISVKSEKGKGSIFYITLPDRPVLSA